MRGVGIFGFADLANFILQIWSIFFRFSLLKIAVFWFWCFVRFADFLQFSLRFSVFVNNDGGFSDLLPNSFDGFSGFAKEVTSCSHAKTLTVRGMHDKPSRENAIPSSGTSPLVSNIV